ncbi:SurA N-terminal domain-containing protein [Nocardioides zhouii]|nr:SurA N-terminal domain-containing protein [Nocardioides zhouii]
MNHLMFTRSVLGLVAATSMLVLSACGGGSDSSSSGSSDKDASASESSSASADPSADAAGGPDLSGIPDVVAEVNGEEVTKDEFVPIYEAAFQQAAAQAQTSGQAPDEEALRQETADNLISAELLAQEAETRGIEVSDGEIDAELTRLAEENQLPSAEELLAAIEKNGVSEEQARSQVETQLLVEQLVEDEDGGQGPTEKELRAIYDQAKQQAAAQEGGQKIPPFDQVRDQIEEQAKTEQVSKVANALVQDLRKDADITINL